MLATTANVFLGQVASYLVAGGRSPLQALAGDDVVEKMAPLEDGRA